MLNINETLQASTLGSIEDHSRESLEHFYVKFPNGRILSILRGTSLYSGEYIGGENGGVETVVLCKGRSALGFYSFDEDELENIAVIDTPEGLIAEVERVAALV